MNQNKEFEEICHVCGRAKTVHNDMNTDLGDPGFICNDCEQKTLNYNRSGKPDAGCALECAACQKTITSTPIRVELEKYTHHERVFIACSDECADILRDT